MQTPVTTYRPLGGTTTNFLRDKILYILAVLVTFILFLLFVLWILILLFIVNTDLSDVNHNENLISQAFNNYLINNPSETGDGNTGDGDGNTGGNTFNTFNTYATSTYDYYLGPPVDGLITSVTWNGVPCDIAPPISPLGRDFFNHAFADLERIWSDLMTDLDISGLSMAIVFDQQVWYQKSFGVANRTQDSVTGAVKPNTIFKIGGLTRLFTTLLAFALRDEGRLGLDTPLVSLLPNFTIQDPFGSDPVTIKQLLGDLAGLPRSTPPGCDPYSCANTTDEVLDLIRNSGLSLINPPFTQPSRSDLAFALAGRALENLPQLTTYENAIDAYITSKLNMSDTTFALSSEQMARAALGYENGGAVTDYDIGWMRPWGGLYSTQDDMIKLLLALNRVDKDGAPYANKILETQTLREMELPIFMNPDSKTGQGTPFLMLYLKNKLARTLGGSIVGFGSHLLLVPNLRLGVLALANAEADMSQFTVPVATKLIPLMEQLLDALAPPPEVISGTTKPFEGKYLGVNSKGEVGFLVVSTDGNGIVRVADSRWPATVYYELSYVGIVARRQRFRVSWKGDPQVLSCLLIFSAAVQGEFMDFQNLSSGQYDSVLFQGEQYTRFSG